MSLGLQVSSCGMSFCPKTLSCPSRGFASHLLVARDHQSSSRSVAPKNLTVVPPAFSKVMAKKAVRRALGRIVFAILCTLTHLPSRFSPVVSCFIREVFSPVHPFHTGIQCSCCRLQVHDDQMLTRSTNVFCSVPSCHIWHGRLHIRQN